MSDKKTGGKLNLKQRLHLFSSPSAEAMDEGSRITEMCKVSWEALDRIKELEAENERLKGRLAHLVDSSWEALDRTKALENENERLREEAKDAKDTLKAWFDRRKLTREAVDQAVIDAASGYLRTSRIGGMSQEESDLVLGVIEAMTSLGLFANLFARAALKEGDDGR